MKLKWNLKKEIVETVESKIIFIYVREDDGPYAHNQKYDILRVLF